MTDDDRYEERERAEMEEDRLAEIEAERDQLRARVTELETLHDAAAKATEALERIGEQARQRIGELATGLREALDAWYDRVLDGDVPMRERLYRLADRTEAETPADNLEAKHQRFAALRDELIAAGVCLSCGQHKPGRACQCENDE